MNKSEQSRLVQLVADEIYEAYPYLWEKFGQNGRDRTEEDNFHHLDHLQAAYEMDSVDFFMDYTKWLNTVLTSREVPTSLIIDNYERLVRLLKNMEVVDEDEKQCYIKYLDEALQHLHTLSKR
ncbi:hypothetical protein GLW00_04670 [Halobacillus litoralis]|uniref:Uncharacterized protein n=1 Tax=Halobacillus litoralis TaxID=45668 RepID=A0A845F8A3_9BACI|nr:hypothetical protein [Halobacillus sp. HZG1]MEC3884527.1 hypothetical protein [Halobacillus sp. HZG1]MYL70129.1 hypothetical protein [Halobacillus litoralis]